PRIDEVVKRDAGARPATDGGAGGRDRAARDGNHLALRRRRQRAVLRDEHAPATEGRGSGDRDVSAETDQGAACARPGERGRGGEIGGEGFADGPEVELDAACDAYRSVLRIQLDRLRSEEHTSE